jgi:NAD(P)-dependent dehydrogenase (short-subunit alcohol dehydrogenase family)
LVVELPVVVVLDDHRVLPPRPIQQRQAPPQRKNGTGGKLWCEGVTKTRLACSGSFAGFKPSRSPLGRIGQPNDISPTAVYLASSDSKYLTDEIIRVTGGIL